MTHKYSELTAGLQGHLAALRGALIPDDDEETDSELERLRLAIADAEEDGIVFVEPLFYPLFDATAKAAAAACEALGTDDPAGLVANRAIRLLEAAAWPLGVGDAVTGADDAAAGVLLDINAFAHSSLKTFCDDYVAQTDDWVSDSDEPEPKRRRA